MTCQSTVDMNRWNEIPPTDFVNTQLQFPRVRAAFEAKTIDLKKLLLKQDLESFAIDVYVRAFKQEELLEVWIKERDTTSYRLLEVYDFCRNSGTLGPKRKQGDFQIPEGFYRISHYNPKSNFLLSLRVNYPNASDKILSDQEKPGGDIYIHGGCQTVGCIPITNEKIQELYTLAVWAKQEGQNIPIHIFPFKMTDQKLQENLIEFPSHETFWKNLQMGYQFFEPKKILPKVIVLPSGDYGFE